MHVLLIEPDALLAKTYEAALRTEGHRVSRAVTAQQAVAAADIEQPDVVVLALGMARHNGVEFLYEFKSYTEWRDVPVIALVSRLNHDMADHGSLRRELGVQKVLIRSQLTLKNLCEAVTSAGQSKP
jgi:DNA-binding response OmpR family regulator